MNLQAQCEALLLVAGKPLTAKKIAELTHAPESEVKSALKALQSAYKDGALGIQLIDNGNAFQFATHGECAALIETYMKEEVVGDLTRPALETLTIIAYRGPVTKPELEQIRGVNCTMILRNLAMRGLIESEESRELLQPVYRVTLEFMRFLGLASASELPEYGTLHSHELFNQIMQADASASQ